MSSPSTLVIDMPAKAAALFEPRRYKGLRGGRGSAKSHSVAEYLLIEGMRQKHRFLCCREYQASIADSVHKLLSDKIAAKPSFGRFYRTQRSTITGANGTEFLFAGLKHNIANIKSMEGITKCWCEEAQTISEESWETLVPTIRAEGSEIIVTFNPRDESDPTYQRFVVKPSPETLCVEMNWRDNPWFPSTLNAERKYLRSVDLEAYAHVWEGKTKAISDAVIFGKRVTIDAFETPDDARLFHGADWGFAGDPTALVRSFIQNDRLMIDAEAFGFGIEIDETPQLFDSIPSSRKWPIKADASRPETISYMRRQGFAISPAEKWPGSVEDGIAHLKAFKQIVIHPRCKHMQEEQRLYSYKLDRVTGEILPVIVDKHNHGWDAVRYSLDGYIQRRGGLSVWEKLAS